MISTPALLCLLIVVVLCHNFWLQSVISQFAQSRRSLKDALEESRRNTQRMHEETRSWRASNETEMEEVRKRREEMRQFQQEQVARGEEMLRLQREQLVVLQKIASQTGAPRGTAKSAKPGPGDS